MYALRLGHCGQSTGFWRKFISSFAVCTGIAFAGSLRAAPVPQPGAVVSWGEPSIPLAFYDGQKILQVAAGLGHNLALKSDGTVVAWGSKFSGEGTVPAGLNTVVQIAAGV